MNTAIHQHIEKLLVYASQHLMLDDLDGIYARNNILTEIGLTDYDQYEVDESKIEALDNIDSLLTPVIDWAVANGTTKVKDKPKLQNALMYHLVAKPSQVATVFEEQSKLNPAKALEWLKDYLKKCNYFIYEPLLVCLPELESAKIKASKAPKIEEHSVPELEDLLAYARAHLLLDERDLGYIRNRLIAIFNLSEFTPHESDYEIIDEHSVPDVLLEAAVSLAKEFKIIKDGSEKLFGDLVMGTLCLKPSEIFDTYEKFRNKNHVKAFEWIYEYAIKSNYINYSNIAQNPHWEAKSTVGKLEVTINLARQEKLGQEDKKAVKGGSYPLCDICKESEGYLYRKTLRTIPVDLSGEEWFWQYSPHSYFHQHGTLVKAEHTPLKVDNTTFKRLLDFNDYAPNYFIGVNAALEGVGGSILSHDHFQGGKGNLALFRAPVLKQLRSAEHPYMKIEVLDWYLPTIRLIYTNKAHLANFASTLQKAWEDYSDSDIDLVAKTGAIQHNAVAAASRKINDGQYALDLFLRNNRSNSKYPNGIFSAKGENRAIKAESVGIIESLGHFILPPRLVEQLKKIEKYLTKESRYNVEKLMGTEMEIFIPIIEKLLKDAPNRQTPFEATLNIKYEVNRIVEQILIDCAVFKPTEEGREGLWKFLASVGIE
ncbi:MAG: hypothetical protein FWE13_04010 [Firmicutes bacterium]|nr:hypothetical protein [Bacillota bacterium]